MPTPNLGEFFENFLGQYGFAKTHRFDVTLSLPFGLQGKGFEAMIPLATLRCESAELPGKQIVTTDSKIYGPIYKAPYQTLFSDITLVFVETAQLHLRNFFEAWSRIIYDQETNIMGYMEDFVTDILVTQYDEREGTIPGSPQEIQSFQLIHAYPTNINQLTTSWSDDQIHRLSVTFTYQRYRILPQPVGLFATGQPTYFDPNKIV